MTTALATIKHTPDRYKKVSQDDKIDSKHLHVTIDDYFHYISTLNINF